MPMNATSTTASIWPAISNTFAFWQVQTPRLSLGCDFHLSYDNLQEVLVAPERFTIEDTHYLLVELSNYSIPTQINDYFTKMADVGITPGDHTS